VAEEEGLARQWVSRRGQAGEGAILEELIRWLESTPEVPVLGHLLALPTVGRLPRLP
jgi:hypothetical protein